MFNPTNILFSISPWKTYTSSQSRPKIATSSKINRPFEPSIKYYAASAKKESTNVHLSNSESVEKYSIDIILATDDVISMGYRESVTIQEVESQLKMESAEEKAHIALVKQQEQDAKIAAEKVGGKK